MIPDGDGAVQPEVVDEPMLPGVEVPEGESVAQPTKLIRIASMVRALLDEARRAPLDDAGRRALKEIHERSVRELEGLFHGIQATLFTQQMQAQRQFEEMRQRRAIEMAPGDRPSGAYL